MTQNFENHARIVPGYHYGVHGILAANLLWSIYQAIRAFSAAAVISLLLAVGLILLAYYARVFALTVQDRVIRLEMTLRLERLLPAELRPRIGEFTVGQLVALRFAGDAELPELARKVLSENLADRAAIKKMIRDWRPDLLRA